MFCSTDYNQVELCALAQDCLTRYGRSKMADIINEGTDLHTFFGRKICETEGFDPDLLDEKIFKNKFRAYAKVLNFGFNDEFKVAS